MNVKDMLMYGDRTWMTAVEACPREHMEVSGALGWWSVKDIISHMAAGEVLAVEVLNNIVHGTPISSLEERAKYGIEMNDIEVRRRSEISAGEVIAEYQEAHAQLMALVPQVSPEKYRENGTIPWYGDAYCLDDFLVYTNYAHKREHAGHIDVFRDRMEGE